MFFRANAELWTLSTKISPTVSMRRTSEISGATKPFRRLKSPLSGESLSLFIEGDTRLHRRSHLVRGQNLQIGRFFIHLGRSGSGEVRCTCWFTKGWKCWESPRCRLCLVPRRRVPCWTWAIFVPPWRRWDAEKCRRCEQRRCCTCRWSESIKDWYLRVKPQSRDRRAEFWHQSNSRRIYIECKFVMCYCIILMEDHCHIPLMTNGALRNADEL